jgi:hypothetical protein
VNEVVGCAAALKLIGERDGNGQVAALNGDPGSVPPISLFELSRFAGDAPNPIARVEESRNEAATDIPRRTRHGDWWLRGRGFGRLLSQRGLLRPARSTPSSQSTVDTEPR